MVLFMGYINIPSHYHNIVQRDLDLNYLDILQNIRLVLYFEDMILNRPEKQAVISILEALVRLMNSKCWETNSMNI